MAFPYILIDQLPIPRKFTQGIGILIFVSTFSQNMNDGEPGIKSYPFFTNILHIKFSIFLLL